MVRKTSAVAAATACLFASAAEAAQLRAGAAPTPPSGSPAAHAATAAFPAALPQFHLPTGAAPPAQQQQQHLAKAAAAATPVHLAATNRSSAVGVAKQAPSFQAFYDSYSAGPGIWKWSNALAAYDRFLAPMSGQPVKLAEVGIQSGGSVVMWKNVLGSQCHVYGIDINPAVNKFADPMTTITIGDQADPNMWNTFFTTKTGGPIDALIDDGGHEAHQMLTTLQSVFDNLTPGGIIALEDIHGEHYTTSFFTPAARYLGAKAAWGQLSSVHIFPFVLVARRAGNDMRAPIQFGGTTETVSEFAQLWEAIPRHWGGHVVLENSGWGPFLTEQGLTNFFAVFSKLHASTWSDTPKGCEHTAAAVCTVTVANEQMQSVITGVHVFPNRLVVEVAGGPVVLKAVRHGTEWLPY